MIEIKINNKINSFLKKLNLNNIEVLKIKGNKIYIKSKDLKKLENLITIYDVEIIGKTISIKKINKTFLLSSIISIMFIFILSKIIFNINIITEDPEIKKLLIKELKNNNIQKFKFKKNNLEEITNKIINNNKPKIEWLYIEEKGTTYNVRVQIRNIKKQEKAKVPNNIVAKKNAVIKKIDVSSGEIIKKINDYVKKGEDIVTGNIKLNEETKNITYSTGNIYGEVWYRLKIEQPIILYEKIKKNELNINYYFLNKIINIKGEKEKNNLKKLLPIGLQISKSKAKVVNTILNYEEAKTEAYKNATKKINSKLSDKEYIISSQILKENLNNSKIELEIFYTVYEDITEYKNIE